MKKRIIIRPIRRIEEYHACERIQQTVWRFGNREIIPLNELLTIQRHGGLVLGAFTVTNRMIGFVFGFPGLLCIGVRNRESIHVSRMLAVLPAYRNSDIGYRLKLAQRAFALKQGIRLVTWTFDPLQSINAYFNIEKLGVIVREYHVNIYGASASVLNRGFDTDRLQAEWWVRSPRVKRCTADLSRPKRREALRTQRKSENIISLCDLCVSAVKVNGLIAPGPVNLKLRTPRIAVEIPSDINRLKKHSPTLARKWRRITRKIFLHYFEKSYIVTGFISQKSYNQRRSFYILEKR